MPHAGFRAADPIFFVGAPRSGTTVLFESIVHHEAVAWLPSQWRLLRSPTATGLYLRAFTQRRWHRVRHKPQLPGDVRRSTRANRWMPAPTEGYEFWQERFQADMEYDFLLDERPGVEECARARAWIERLLRASGRARFVHKFTGPARIGFLSRAFPEATFVHLLRDPVAVVSSLLDVEFWIEGGGLERPWWRGLPKRYEAVIQERPVPEVLALVQCRAIVDLAREEARERPETSYHEVRYEDFVSEPEGQIRSLLERCGLGSSPQVEAVLRDRPIRDRNAEGRRRLRPEQLENVRWALSRL